MVMFLALPWGNRADWGISTLVDENGICCEAGIGCVADIVSFGLDLLFLIMVELE